MILFDLLLSYPDTNNRYLMRYIKFIKTRGIPRINDYTEVHHILPRSIFPEHINTPENLLHLTAREHYIAHHLLYKSFPKIPEMTYAFWAMCNGWKKSRNQCRYEVNKSSRTYGRLKAEISSALSARMSNSSNPFNNPEVKLKIIETYGGLGNASSIILQKQKQTMLSRYGYENIFQDPSFIEKTRQLTISRNKDPNYRLKQGLEIAKALEHVNREGANNSFYGKTHSEDAKQKIRLAKIGKTFPLFSCLCCRKTMGVNNYTRHTNKHVELSITTN